jgi:hypothetical protein
VEMAVVTNKLAYNEMELIKYNSTCPWDPCFNVFYGHKDFCAVVSMSVCACQTRVEVGAMTNEVAYKEMELIK